MSRQVAEGIIALLTNYKINVQSFESQEPPANAGGMLRMQRMLPYNGSS